MFLVLYYTQEGRFHLLPPCAPETPSLRLVTVWLIHQQLPMAWKLLRCGIKNLAPDRPSKSEPSL